MAGCTKKRRRPTDDPGQIAISLVRAAQPLGPAKGDLGEVIIPVPKRKRTRQPKVSSRAESRGIEVGGGNFGECFPHGVVSVGDVQDAIRIATSEKETQNTHANITKPPLPHPPPNLRKRTRDYNARNMDESSLQMLDNRVNNDDESVFCVDSDDGSLYSTDSEDENKCMSLFTQLEDARIVVPNEEVEATEVAVEQAAALALLEGMDITPMVSTAAQDGCVPAWQAQLEGCVRQLSEGLRENPTVPPNPARLDEPWQDADDGSQWPVKHCGSMLRCQCICQRRLRSISRALRRRTRSAPRGATPCARLSSATCSTTGEGWTRRTSSRR